MLCLLVLSCSAQIHLTNVSLIFFFLSKIIYSIISGTFCVVERISIISKAVQLTVNVFSASLENIMSHVSCMWLWLCGFAGEPPREWDAHHLSTGGFNSSTDRKLVDHRGDFLPLPVCECVCIIVSLN